MVAHLPTRPRRRIAPLLLWALQTHSPVGRVLQEISMCSNIPDAHEPNSAADILKASATHDADRGSASRDRIQERGRCAC